MNRRGNPLMPAQAAIQKLGPRFRGDERRHSMGLCVCGLRLDSCCVLGLTGNSRFYKCFCAVGDVAEWLKAAVC